MGYEIQEFCVMNEEVGVIMWSCGVKKGNALWDTGVQFSE